MINVLILGANGQLARNTTRVFLRDTDAKREWGSAAVWARAGVEPRQPLPIINGSSGGVS
jgi:hypothetical protein